MLFVTSSHFIEHCCSVFLVFKKTSVSYFQLWALHDVQEDANGCAGREREDERQEKDWHAILAGEYAKDHAEMVTHLAYLLVRQTKIPAGISFSFYPLLIFISTAPHCSFRPHSTHGRRSSLAGSTLPSHT